MNYNTRHSAQSPVHGKPIHISTYDRLPWGPRASSQREREPELPSPQLISSKAVTDISNTRLRFPSFPTPSQALVPEHQSASHPASSLTPLPPSSRQLLELILYKCKPLHALLLCKCLGEPPKAPGLKGLLWPLPDPRSVCVHHRGLWTTTQTHPAPSCLG